MHVLPYITDLCVLTFGIVGKHLKTVKLYNIKINLNYILETYVWFSR